MKKLVGNHATEAGSHRASGHRIENAPLSEYVPLRACSAVYGKHLCIALVMPPSSAQVPTETPFNAHLLLQGLSEKKMGGSLLAINGGLLFAFSNPLGKRDLDTKSKVLVRPLKQFL